MCFLGQRGPGSRAINSTLCAAGLRLRREERAAGLWDCVWGHNLLTLSSRSKVCPLVSWANPQEARFLDGWVDGKHRHPLGNRSHWAPG